MRKLLCLLVLLTLASCSSEPSPAVPPKIKHAHYIGVSVPGDPLNMKGIRSFARLTGTHPNIISYYSAWYEDFDTTAVRKITNYGALPFVFLDSGRVPMGEVIDGSHWLSGYAKEVKAFRKPVAISFDSDFNGPWWPWSEGHETAKEYVTAWHHVVDVFRSVGANNVIWVWTVAKGGPHTVRLRPWWPGNSYIDWVGVNGYYVRPTDTFKSIFTKVFSEIRSFSNHPILITETGANEDSDRPRAIANLFRSSGFVPGLLGFVYFDYSKHKAGRRRWRIDDDTAALSAYRAAAKS